MSWSPAKLPDKLMFYSPILVVNGCIVGFHYSITVSTINNVSPGWFRASRQSNIKSFFSVTSEKVASSVRSARVKFSPFT